jgi:hypothetical protein
MKGLMILLGIGVVTVIALGWWYTAGMAADPGFRVPMAVGKGRAGGLEAHIAVSIPLMKLERPRVDRRTGAVYWTEWVEDHFELRDASGQPVRVQRSNFSSLIADGNVGSPDLYLVAELKDGAEYTYDCVPVKGGPQRYRYAFTPRAAEDWFGRVHFEPVD